MAYLATYSVATQAFVDTLKGDEDNPGINTLMGYLKNLLIDDGLDFLKDTISFEDAKAFAKKHYGDENRWGDIAQVRDEAKMQRQGIGIGDIAQIDRLSATLMSDLLLENVDEHIISACFSLNHQRNRFYVKPENIEAKVVPSNRDVQQQLFPHETPSISVFIPETEGGPRPSAGPTEQADYEFECVLYVMGFEARETEARANLIGQAIKTAILQANHETPINQWRSGELYFVRGNTISAPVANTRILTRNTTIFLIQKTQNVPTL